MVIQHINICIYDVADVLAVNNCYCITLLCMVCIHCL